MADRLVCGESPVEFFKDQVEGAMQRQGIAASAWTTYYVVNLLAGFALGRSMAGPSDEPLGIRLTRSLQAEGPKQREGLREVGDASLFLAGFFGESLNRRLVDIDYYVMLGGYAYGKLADEESEAFADVFGEMAQKFVTLVDVLSEISERSALSSNRDLLRLYERWLRTGSRRNGELLMEQGIVPIAGGSTQLQ